MAGAPGVQLPGAERNPKSWEEDSMGNARGSNEPMFKSLDGVTSPVSFTRGEAGGIEVTMMMTEAGFDLFWKLSEKRNLPLESVITRSLVLYKASTDAVDKGKSVGVASNPGVLEVEFTDL